MGQKTKIDWCDSSWNPVTGCEHGCPYCYARGIAERFKGWDDSEDGYQCVMDGNGLHAILELNRSQYKEDKNGKKISAPYPLGFIPTLHRYKLDEIGAWQKPRTIFVCSMADLFGDWVPDEWIQTVFEATYKAPQHRYLFLTKNPRRYVELSQQRILPTYRNYWFGTTITNADDPFFWDEFSNTFVSIEPILESLGDFEKRNARYLPNWIIIGAETGNRKGKVIPEKAWVDEIVDMAYKNGIPVFMKESLRRIMGEDFKQEFPWEVEA